MLRALPDSDDLTRTLARLESLTELAFALSGAVTPQEVSDLVVEQGMRQAQSDIATLYVLDESGEQLELLSQRGVAAEVLAKIERINRLEGNPRVLETLSTGVSVWAENEHEYDAIFPEVARLPATGQRAKALWSVPLVVEGRPVGLLGMGFYEPRRFSNEDRRFAETFAKLCAQALLRAVRRERELVTRRRLERQRAFLARAMETFASSLDYLTTLSRVAELAVPELADWCTVDILEPGTTVPRQLAVAHVDPAKVAYAREIGVRYPPDRNATTGAPQVIRSGVSELYPNIPMPLVEAAAKDADHLRILRELKLESAMVVPLRSSEGGRTLGAMSFIYADSGRRYSEEDLTFAEDFARRAVLAIDNSRAASEVEAARAREQLMRERAELASVAKDHFLATVSHELRTPLNVILGWAVVLREREQELAPEVQRALSVIERNARAQARLIEDVLDLSRISSGKLSLALGPVHVGEAVRAAALNLRPAAVAKGIVLTVAGDLEQPQLSINADGDRLQQVLWNLLTNALKFTPKGGTIAISAERVGSEVQVQVEDSGEGMPAALLPHVFEPFRQADASTTRRHGGLGLGLSLVKQIVAAHGGTVEATSAGLGRGATFLVRLPATAATSAVQPLSTRRAAALHLGEAGPLSGIVIVVVDDEQDARELVGEAFRSAGASVHLAASAVEALPLITRQRPAALVSDIGMPHEDGYALMRRVRALPADQGGQIPALALTAYAQAEDAERAFEAGFQRHVAKPVDPLALVDLVLGLVGRATPAPRS